MIITIFAKQVVTDDDIKNLINQYSDMVPIRISNTCVAMRDKDVYDPSKAKSWETISVDSIGDIIASSVAA